MIEGFRKLEVELARRLPTYRRAIVEVMDAWQAKHLIECMVQRTIDSPRLENHTREFMQRALGEYAVRVAAEEWDNESDIGGRSGQIKTLRLTVIKP